MDKKTFQHLCELSKLSFGEDQQDEIIEQMDGIIALMDRVCDYDDRGYEADGAETATPYGQLREDKAHESLFAQKLLQNADEKGNCTLPKIIG